MIHQIQATVKIPDSTPLSKTPNVTVPRLKTVPWLLQISDPTKNPSNIAVERAAL